MNNLLDRCLKMLRFSFYNALLSFVIGLAFVKEGYSQVPTKVNPALSTVSAASGAAASTAPSVPASSTIASLALTDNTALVEILKRIQNGAQQQNYTGVYVYQYRAQIQSSRISHWNEAEVESEKLERLDGHPREFIRHNDEIHYFMPEKQMLLIERKPIQDRFPALLSGNVDNIVDYYGIKYLGTERIAGRECYTLVLEPRDDARYGYRLCADKTSNLLLKIQTLNEQRDVIEQIAFSHVMVGADVTREVFKPKWPTENWKVARVEVEPYDFAAAGWIIKDAPRGFKPVKSVKRKIGNRLDVKQWVWSDGLSAISIFIESTPPAHPQKNGIITRGAVNTYTQKQGNYWITIVGEVPAIAVKRMADSLVAPL